MNQVFKKIKISFFSWMMASIIGALLVSSGVKHSNSLLIAFLIMLVSYITFYFFRKENEAKEVLDSDITIRQAFIEMNLTKNDISTFNQIYNITKITKLLFKINLRLKTINVACNNLFSRTDSSKDEAYFENLSFAMRQIEQTMSNLKSELDDTNYKNNKLIRFTSNELNNNLLFSAINLFIHIPKTLIFSIISRIANKA